MANVREKTDAIVPCIGSRRLHFDGYFLKRHLIT